MPKSIVIVGAGPGLGRAVAARFAREGYTIVLAARRQEALEQLAAELSAGGATAHAIAADVGDGAALAHLITQIREVVGTPDAIYYSPAIRGYVAVTDLTAEPLRELMPIALYGLVDLVHAFLPDMLERGSGAVLAAAAPSATVGIPQLSATAGLAAQRNYLQSLQAAVSERGIFVGRLYIGATIEHSAFHQAQEAARAAGQPTIDLPIVSPDHLADLLWEMQRDRALHELIYPQG